VAGGVEFMGFSFRLTGRLYDEAAVAAPAIVALSLRFRRPIGVLADALTWCRQTGAIPALRLSDAADLLRSRAAA
jgi:hypothetical protein